MKAKETTDINDNLVNEVSSKLKETPARHSDEIDEIITKIPSWILRWGIVMFAGILLIALSISAIIRYPDIVKAPVKFEVTDYKSAKIFTGIIKVSENNIAKIKSGQRVIIRLKTYPAEQYGVLTGHIIDIADDPDVHQLFTIKVQLNYNSINKSFVLKKWMTGNAEIITQDVTALQRIYYSLTNNIRNN